VRPTTGIGINTAFKVGAAGPVGAVYESDKMYKRRIQSRLFSRRAWTESLLRRLGDIKAPGKPIGGASL